MEVQFKDKIEFGKIELDIPRDVVACSIIAQKSITHLDLSACEYSLSLDYVSTEEQCRKLMEPRRHILYTLNLDLPKNLESSLRAVIPNADDQEHFETFHLGVVFVCESVYTFDFTKCIINAIMSAENRIEKLRKFLNAFKLLRLNRCWFTSTFLFDNLIKLLFPLCSDSDLVIEFAFTLGFCSWVFHTNYPIFINYVLHHAMLARQNILQVTERSLDHINGCILHRRPQHIFTLLTYGTNLHFDSHIYLEVLRTRIQPRIMERFLQRNMPHRRLFLVLQLFFYAWQNYQWWEGLLFIWRSIPDPYLTVSEIFCVFESFITLEEIYNLIKFYKDYVVEETDDIVDAVPRPLQHLCRVTVRSTLNRNYQLPYGVNRIAMNRNYGLPCGNKRSCMPRILQSYLLLKC